MLTEFRKQYTAMAAGDGGPLRCVDLYDEQSNPTGGSVVGTGFTISWQDGPRATDSVTDLAPANGAFVEDVILAAKLRLETFQASQYACPENTEAIEYLRLALEELDARRVRRREEGTEGQHIPGPTEEHYGGN